MREESTYVVDVVISVAVHDVYRLEAVAESLVFDWRKVYPIRMNSQLEVILDGTAVVTLQITANPE